MAKIIKDLMLYQHNPIDYNNAVINIFAEDKCVGCKHIIPMHALEHLDAHCVATYASDKYCNLGCLTDYQQEEPKDLFSTDHLV